MVVMALAAALFMLASSVALLDGLAIYQSNDKAHIAAEASAHAAAANIANDEKQWPDKDPERRALLQNAELA